jgi:hypothetical protein
MREWLEKHPEQRAEKFNGRKLWWDKEAKNMDDLRRIQESKVAQKAYVYDVNSSR